MAGTGAGVTDGLDLMEPEEPLIRLDMIFGHVKVDSRIRWEGSRGIGEGRSRTYDGKGNLTNDTGWEPTGVVIDWPPEPSVTRQFWQNLRESKRIREIFSRIPERWG